MTAPRRGVALVMVLWIIVILGGIGAAVMRSARTSIALAANVRASAVARYAAEGGIEATVDAIERTLAASPDSVARGVYLNSLSTRPPDSIAVGDARSAVLISDPSARIDVNAALAGNLATLLSRFTGIGDATENARAIKAWIDRPPRGVADGQVAGSTPGAFHLVTPVRSLDELSRIPGVDRRLLERAAPYLTIDGDGTVNRQTASDTVLAAAFGELRDEPSRLLLVSRGWQTGHPLTHEIQAVYAISGTNLVLVHWRERDL